MIRPARIFGVVIALIAAGTAVVGSLPSAADQNEGGTPPLVDAQRLIAVGGLHTCAVMNTGVVRCWGDNANGQLGNGTRAVSTAPKPVLGITDAVAITAGNAHTCALLKNATVSCWGLNSNGQIGSDAVLVNSSTTAKPVPGLTEVRAIAAGGFHNCALLDTRKIKCWGLDGAGQLGDGAGTPAGEAFKPVEVAGITDAIAVGAGEFHTCALLATGGVKCWGHNGFGQLGNNSATDSTAPVAVSGLPDGDKKALNITLGYGHSCVVLDDFDPALDENTIRCWGNNNQGQLGDGSTTDRKTPVTVQYDKDSSEPAYDYDALKGADVVTAGQQHTCARKVSGLAWCWGNAGRGQIGDGTKGEGDTNIFVPEQFKFMWRSARPASIDLVEAITAGGFHTCALRGSSMRCWGYNFYGQLGSYLSSSAVPITVTALQGAASVATGTDAACARVLVPGTPDTHKPMCWGTNVHGELGANLTNPPTANSTVPVQVFGQSDVSTITAGNGHACTLPTGSASPLCWGNNDDGQLGNSSTTNANAPVAVSGLTTATQLSAGGRSIGINIAHTCARLQDGTVQCWGENEDGQLGNNSPAPPATSQSTSPVTVLYDQDPAPPDADDDHFDPVPLPNVVQVAAGGTHSCALRNDGTATTVWCWGRNLNGQLGDNTTTQRRLATQVKLVDDPAHDPPVVYLTGVQAITAGERHTCALMAGAENGKVRCWGANNRGQLGDGTVAERHLPKLIPNIPIGSGDSRNPLAVALTAGMSHTCAIMANASARCWGENSAGQLGSGGASFSPTPVTPVGLDNNTADTIRTNLSGTGLPADLVTSLSAGRRNTCASLIDMTVSCWGSNSSGQLGDGIGPTRATPIDVLNLDEGVNGNKSPNATDDVASAVEDTPVTVNVTANDSDPDGNPVTVLQATDPAHGSAGGSGSTVTYDPDLDYCGSDTVSYRIFDGKNGIADAVITVTISCVQDAPVALDDTITTPEEVAVTVPVLDNDTDVDGDTLTVSSVTQPAHGTISVVAGGVKYSPAANYNGPDSFTYVVGDGAGGTDTGSVTISVSAGNDAPVALDDTMTTPEEVAVTVPVLDNDTDVDGDTLTVSSVTQPAHGTISVVAGGLKYSPAANYNGPDSFNYVVVDGNGGIDSATVSVTVSATNDAPVANDDSATTTKDVVITVPVLSNDTDPDGDILSISSASQPNHGSTTINAGGIKYSPKAGYAGPDSFTYVVDDGNGANDSATVTMTVGPGNFPPFAGDDMASVAEDASLNVTVLSNDFDSDGDTLTVTSVTQPANGSTTIEGGGIRYTPVPDYYGPDSFTYVVSDGNGGTDTAAVTMTVTAVADPPDAVDDAASTPEDTPLTVAVLVNDSDPDGDVLSVSSITQPTHGSAAIIGGGVRYTPASDHSGSDSFTYSVLDGHGGSDTATVSIIVIAVNDPPTLEPIGDQTMQWGAVATAYATGHDVDSALLTYSLVSPPSFAVVDSEGTITLTPGVGDIGVRTITARVSDGAASADRSFKVAITKQTPTIAYTGAAWGQYSDPTGLAAKLTGLGGGGINGATVAFSIAGQSANAATNATGDASAEVVLASAPGSANAVASFAGSPAYEPASVSAPFTVNAEDALTAITGPGLVTTSGGTASATLFARVQELSDGYYGSLAGAHLQFTDVSGAPLCTAAVSVSSPGSGTASCATAALAHASRGVIARLVSTLYSAPLDVAALAVASVPSGAAAGGGSVMDSVAQRSDFGFTATPGKRGAAPTGDAVQVFRRQADLGSGTRSYAFVVRASSLESLTRDCTGKSVKVCSATIQASDATTAAVDLETGTVSTVIGTSKIRIDATDNGEPSGGTVPPDGYAVAISGPWPFSVGTPTEQRLLTAGNIRIPV